MASPEMPAALVRGTIGAAPVFEPFLTAARKAGGVRILAPGVYDVLGRNPMISGYFARNEWLAANAATARRVAQVIYNTGVWANAHSAESAAVLVRVGKLDPSVARDMVRVPYGKTLVPAMLQPTLDLAFKYKVTERRIAAEEIIAKI
jgi:sulfonate transport system substrate-binding protein